MGDGKNNDDGIGGVGNDNNDNGDVDGIGDDDNNCDTTILVMWEITMTMVAWVV